MGSLIRTDISELQERIDEISGAVDFGDVVDTIQELRTEILKNKLTCLCAPQIGKKLRLFVVKTADKKYDAFLNPMIVSKSKEIHLSMENNASIPDKYYIIPRYNEVHVAFQTSDGHVDSKSYKGAYGEVVQQMIEMLDGITLADYGLDLDDLSETGKDGLKVWNKASKKEQAEVLAMYVESLQKQSDDLHTEIEGNEELKQVNDTIDFNTKYLLGENKPIDADGNVVEVNQPVEKTEEAK